MNVAALVLFRARARGCAGAFLLYGALPLVGAIVDAGILWRSFFVEAWNGGAMGRSAIAFDGACAGIALVIALMARRSDRP
ncbi:MAG: hypothetical protein JST92_09565 [Deltaproteobacteria bacterium]|nr:hypothetical protein [Deltaproteobacteria bacterium]